MRTIDDQAARACRQRRPGGAAAAPRRAGALATPRHASASNEQSRLYTTTLPSQGNAGVCVTLQRWRAR